MIQARLRTLGAARLPARSAVALMLAAILMTSCARTGATPEPAAPASGAATPSAAVSSLVPSGPTEAARVVRVVDGDTIIIDRGRGEERLRYIGINAPESVKPGSPVEFMGHEASAANTALVDRREVVLEKDVSEVDQYGRLLRYIWLRDGTSWIFVNLELVRRGFAQAATYPPDVRWAELLREAERDARAAGVGLWAEPTPAP